MHDAALDQVAVQPAQGRQRPRRRARRQAPPAQHREVAPQVARARTLRASRPRSASHLPKLSRSRRYAATEFDREARARRAAPPGSPAERAGRTESRERSVPTSPDSSPRTRRCLSAPHSHPPHGGLVPPAREIERAVEPELHALALEEAPLQPGRQVAPPLRRAAARGRSRRGARARPPGRRASPSPPPSARAGSPAGRRSGRRSSPARAGSPAPGRTRSPTRSRPAGPRPRRGPGRSGPGPAPAAKSRAEPSGLRLPAPSGAVGGAPPRPSQRAARGGDRRRGGRPLRETRGRPCTACAWLRWRRSCAATNRKSSYRLSLKQRRPERRHLGPRDVEPARGPDAGRRADD